MQQWRFAASSLAVVLALSLLSCRGGPDVAVCVLDPTHNALQCGRQDGTTFEIAIPNAENFVCFSPDDTEKLLRACRGRE
jgi:hypothetical protein